MLAWPFGDLRPLAYDVFSADPPWQFRTWSDKGQEKSAEKHYRTMTIEEIKALPVGVLARGDAVLLLWTTGWAMATGQAQAVATAWGFVPVTELVWRKTTVNRKVRVGPGYRARTMHEPVLLCVMGNPRHKAFPSLFDGLAREHSRKPEEFYAMVERHTPMATGRLDLFSRQQRPGWDQWGDETGKFEPVAVAA